MVGDRPGLKDRRSLLGMSGSLRERAISTAVLTSVLELAAEWASSELADVGDVPLFNQDLYTLPLPGGVERLRAQVDAADGVVIVSPEYNHGIPGTLKNALDWASRPHNGAPFKGKPVLIVTVSHASTGGVRAQYQIRETLCSMLARPVPTPEIVIGLADTKIVDGRLADAATEIFIGTALRTFASEIAAYRRA